MPGYSSDRFPDLSAEDRDKYTCSICQQIFDCPVTTTCCLQTFCEDCITKWLQTNTTCPYDRKSLNKGELSRAPRVMVNTLGRFNIRCDYCDGGCREVVKLESLSQHTVNCRYKSVKCSTCQCAHILGHDCIEALRAEIEALKMTKNDKATNYYDGGNSSSSNDQSVLSDHKILAECRRHIPAPEVLNTGMSADMTDKTLYIISEQLAKQNSLYLVCKHVVEDMELEFGTDWHCMTDSGRNSVGYYRAVSDRHMTVKFTPVTFNVFYSERLDWTVFKARLKHNKIDRVLNIYNGDMKSAMVSDVTDIVFEVIDRYDSMKDTAAVIEARVSAKYPGKKWQCFLCGNGCADYYVTSMPGTYLNCYVGQLGLVIFQAKSK